MRVQRSTSHVIVKIVRRNEVIHQEVESGEEMKVHHLIHQMRVTGNEVSTRKGKSIENHQVLVQVASSESEDDPKSKKKAGHHVQKKKNVKNKKQFQERK